MQIFDFIQIKYYNPCTVIGSTLGKIKNQQLSINFAKHVWDQINLKSPAVIFTMKKELR